MTITDRSLLDEVLPDSDVSAIYSIRIKAPPEIIYEALENGIPVGIHHETPDEATTHPANFPTEE